MTFKEILDQAIAMLQRRGRLTYGTLKRQFQLDDAALEDLTNELIKGQRLARDEDGAVLVWTGAAVAPPPPTTAPAPLAYTPPYLVEKILTTRSALEGERKQVTVLFADLKGSTELIRDLDPEAAQTLLGLGTLYATIGQQEQARSELSAAIVLYRAMDMTFWLPQTEAALVQVEGQ